MHRHSTFSYSLIKHPKNTAMFVGNFHTIAFKDKQHKKQIDNAKFKHIHAVYLNIVQQ